MDFIIFLTLILMLTYQLVFWNTKTFECKFKFLVYLIAFQPMFCIMNKKFSIVLIFFPIVVFKDLIGENLRKNRYINICFILFLLIINFSMIKSNKIIDSLMWIFIWIEYFLFYFWAAHYKEKVNIESVLYSFLKIGIIVSIIGIIQYSYIELFNGWNQYLKYILNGNIGKYIYSENVVNTLNIDTGNWFNYTTGRVMYRNVSIFTGPDGNGMFSIFILAICFNMIFRKKRSKLVYFATAINIINLVLSFGRASWVGFIVSFLVILCIYRDKVVNYKSITMMICIFIIFILMNNHMHLDIKKIFISIFDTHEFSNNGRLNIWKQNFHMFSLNPILGCGIGNYSSMVCNTFNIKESFIKYTAHSAYFLFLVECGMFGLISFLMLNFNIILVSLKVAKKYNDNDLKIFALSLSSAVVGIMVQYIFDYDFGNFRFLPFIFICVGLMYNVLNNKKEYQSL